MVGRSLAGRRGWWGLSAEEFFAQFERQRREDGAHTVLLSAEAFLGAVQPWDFDDAAAYRNAAREAVERLALLVAGATVTVIVYLRRQDHWLESAMNQNIKFGGLVGGDLATLTAEQAAAVYAPRLDYAATLNMWAEVFGIPAIRVGVYERDQLVDGDVVSDFLGRCGIERSYLREPTWNQASRNEALPRDVLEVKRILNAIPKPKYEERVLVETLRAVARDMGGRSASEPSLLPCATRRKVLERHADGNAAVARTFLGHEDGTLFLEAWPETDDPAGEYTGLSTETALEIELRLDRYWRSPGNRLRLFRHWVAERLRRRQPTAHAAARTLRALALRAAPRRRS
ncbi:hypothetical protein V6X62_02675 [Spiribacter sp. 218]|uniref:hypothetical protein n=1 Tax=Spiribacter pallidus TaxID=1987936 RepID=UPI00349F43C7